MRVVLNDLKPNVSCRKFKIGHKSKIESAVESIAFLLMNIKLFLFIYFFSFFGLVFCSCCGFGENNKNISQIITLK